MNTIKPIDDNSNCYAKYNIDSNEKDPKFQTDDHVKIWTYRNIFAEGYTPNWSKEVFVIKKIKNAVPRTYVVNEMGFFMKKNCRKLIKKNLE